ADARPVFAALVVAPRPRAIVRARLVGLGVAADALALGLLSGDRPRRARSGDGDARHAPAWRPDRTAAHHRPCGPGRRQPGERRDSVRSPVRCQPDRARVARGGDIWSDWARNYLRQSPLHVARRPRAGRGQPLATSLMRLRRAADHGPRTTDGPST